MKKDIHPEFYQSKVTCSGCGNTFEVGSTAKEINIGVCSECHPFYTGKQKIVDSEGRVDKFMKKYAKFQNQ
ncbi:MAG: 50S ribosomal protein L31 [Bdellovibrionota bacterium]